MRFAPVVAATLLIAAPALAQSTDPHAEHAHEMSMPATAPRALDARLPAGEDNAKQALDHSPRHGEYVSVPMPVGGTPIRTWVVYPERRDKAGVVVLIHEIFGLSDWIRAVADQFASEGFIAVAPDLISGMGPGGGGTDSVPSRDDVVKLVTSLTPEQADARVDAVTDWALQQPSANGRAATVGFCWGGGRSFEYAAHRPALRAAVVYYGVSPDSAQLATIHAPVLGLYGGDDARVGATVPPAQKIMTALHRSYEVHMFDGAGHGFLRQQTGRDGANLRATQQAWPRTVAFLKKALD